MIADRNHFARPGRTGAILRRFGLCVVLILGLAAGAPVIGQTPTDMIGGFQNGLVEALKRSTGGDFATRQAAFGPVIMRSFDSQFMARIAAGSYWTTFTPSQQEALAKALERMTVASYAARLKAYRGQVFSVSDAKPATQDRMLVRTRMTRASGEVLNIGYLLERSENAAGWAIVDVWFNNMVSELALRRSEFAPVLRDKGIDVLLSQIDAKTLALAARETTKPPARN